MGTIADQYRDSRQRQKTRKLKNALRSMKLLDDTGIKYDRFQNGYRLVIESEVGIIDFMPTTGFFKVRGGESGEGVQDLIKMVKGK